MSNKSISISFRTSDEVRAKLRSLAAQDKRSVSTWLEVNIEKLVNSLDVVVTPVQSAVTPVQSAVTPVQSAVTPVQSAVTPVQSAVTPVQSVGKLRPDGRSYEDGWPQTRDGILFHSLEEAYDPDAKNWKLPAEETPVQMTAYQIECIKAAKDTGLA